MKNLIFSVVGTLLTLLAVGQPGRPWGITAVDAISGIPRGEAYGNSVAPLGDLNGDGNPDFAVGDPLNNTGAQNAGRVGIVFTQGTSPMPPTPIWIDDAHSTMAAHTLSGGDFFGNSVATADLQGDGLPDLIVGAPGDDDTFINSGAIYIFPIELVGGTPTIRDAIKISQSQLGSGALFTDAYFGRSITAIGNLNSNRCAAIVQGNLTFLNIIFTGNHAHSLHNGVVDSD